MSSAFSFLWTAVRLAVRAIALRPMRSALTAFGILVGIAAVTIVVALAQGAAIVVSKSIDSLGPNALHVQAKPAQRSGLRDADRPSQLDDDDLAAIIRDAPSVKGAAPLVTLPTQVVRGDANVSTMIAGSTREYFDVHDFHPVSGEIWPVSAERNRERVCLIGETVRLALFGPEDPVGKSIRIGRFPFRVLGLLEKKGQNPWGEDQDAVVLIPLSTLRGSIRKGRPGQLQVILMSAKSPDAVSSAQREVKDILRQRHQLGDGAPDDFEVHTQEEVRKTQEEVVSVLEMLLLCIGAVSLVVGGVGVMNIMLVSVAERTREIGIRLAIGARSADIRAQFLVEAVVLSLLGGAFGALASVFGVYALRDVLDLPMRVSFPALSVGMLVSTAIGVCFGFFPARRASRLDPVVALSAD